MSYYYVNLLKQYFQFLVSEYGFSIIKESYSTEMKTGNGSVVYQSKAAIIEVIVDKTEVQLKIGHRKSALEKYYDFQDILKVFAPEVEDVYLRSGITLSLKDSLAIETRMRNLVTLLRKYCIPLLTGDFTLEAKIKEIEDRRARRIWGEVKVERQECNIS